VIKLQHCPSSALAVVTSHVCPDGHETWQMRGKTRILDWGSHHWRPLAPGTLVRVLRVGESTDILQRGMCCRPEGMVVANRDDDYLILWFNGQNTSSQG
jgi:hypothetical protein